ncbi:MAG: peroxiredoxin [Geobacteraceae bacterium]
MLGIGDRFPEYSLTALVPGDLRVVEASSPDDFFTTVDSSTYEGKWRVVFFWPKDFTFVCPSEILAFNKRLAEFKARNCEVIGVSVDSKFTHLAWKNTPVDQGGIGNIQYPLVADLKKEIAKDYGVLFESAGVALRGLFLIDTKGIVRHALINDLPLGRNVAEALRMVDALQFVETHGDQVCPANWEEGAEAMKPTAEGVADYLAKHAKG